MADKTWSCKIGEVADEKLPDGADYPMRKAVAAAYLEITGEEPLFIFSGWGAELDEGERASVEAWERLAAEEKPLTQVRGPA